MDSKIQVYYDVKVSKCYEKRIYNNNFLCGYQCVVRSVTG